MVGHAFLFVSILAADPLVGSRAAIIRGRRQLYCNGPFDYSDNRALCPTQGYQGHCSVTDPVRVCVLESNIAGGAATRLAAQLSLPLLPSLVDALQSENNNDGTKNGFTHILTLEPYECNNVKDYSLGINLIDDSVMDLGKKRKIVPSTRRKLSMKPFFVDFFPPDSSRMGRRSSPAGGVDLLTKAVAPQKGFREGATVYDLTAGFGQDSFVIAKAGAKTVHMVERDPIVASLLADALRRLHRLSTCCNDETIRDRAVCLSKCLSLTQGDGTLVAMQLMELPLDEQPDIIYLDPMFPARYV
jgi:hypothetical protein